MRGKNLEQILNNGWYGWMLVMLLIRDKARGKDRVQMFGAI